MAMRTLASRGVVRAGVAGWGVVWGQGSVRAWVWVCLRIQVEVRVQVQVRILVRISGKAKGRVQIRIWVRIWVWVRAGTGVCAWIGAGSRIGL